MPSAETYSFTHRELLALLIREAGIKDGDWMLQVSFGLSAGNFGPDEDQMSPGAILVVSQLGITKARSDSPRGLVLRAADAYEVGGKGK